MKKVLIVDDSATTRAVVKVYLSGRSLLFWKPTTAPMRCGSLSTNHSAAIIIDLKMPGMDGLSFYRRALEHRAPENPHHPTITGQKISGSKPRRCAAVRPL